MDQTPLKSLFLVIFGWQKMTKNDDFRGVWSIKCLKLNENRWFFFWICTKFYDTFDGVIHFFPTLLKKQEKTILLKSLKFSIFHQIRLSRVYLCRSIIHEICVIGSWKFNHVRIKYSSFSMQNFSSLAFEISDLPTNFQKSKTRVFRDFRVGTSISKFLAL